MPIIEHDQGVDNTVMQGMLPDQFVSEAEKQSKGYIKKTLDHFEIVANSQLEANTNSFAHNYNLVKGILRKEDFYIKDNNVGESFTETLLRDVELPEHVQHYSILNPPLNTLLGEQSKRPDYTKVKAYDDDSKNEELNFKTDILQQYIMQEARNKVTMKLAQQGVEVSEEEMEQLTMDRVEEYLTNYTSMAERWANRILTACKLEFNFKEISEDCFRDLLIAGREFFHVFEDNTKLGFGVENLNPKNVWWLSSPDKKYTSDQSGRNQGAYAAGTIRMMELSEIIQRFNLPKEEIDHLRNFVKEFPHLTARLSNSVNGVSGINSIKYDTYSPYLEQERLAMEANLVGNTTDLNNFLGNHRDVTSFANKFVVLESYHIAKKKVGVVTFLDEEGEEQSRWVDESYEPVPSQIGEVQWTWVNQWYKGLKIGHNIYHLEPFELLDYCPIIGVVPDVKNVSKARSFIDMLKYFQTIYNICVNQVFKLLEKEYGVALLASIRQIPIPKDGDGQDAIDVAEAELRERGLFLVDDSPENLKGGQSSLSQFKSVDLTRSNEIKNRWELARVMKEEAWELVGITRARTGSIAATQTATGTQTEMSQSYAQTEPYFAQHEYLVNQVYQALLDAAQHIEIQKPESTIAYVNTEGEQAFIRVNTDELRMRDLKVFVTSRAEDQRMFEELRQLAQPMLQNGASISDVAVLYSTNSIRQMKDTFARLKKEQDAFMQRNQQMEGQKLEQEQQAIQMKIEAEAQQKELDRQNENYNKEMDRLSKEKIAIISATGYGQVESEDGDMDGVPDVLEMSRLAIDHENLLAGKQDKVQERAFREKELLQKNQLEKEKLKVARENMQNDKDIAKINASAKKKAAAKKPKK